MNILVVDDNETTRRLIRHILENEKVDEAPDGDVAVFMANKKRYDLVIMDLMMPRMNGMEAANAIKKMENPPRVVFLTGYAEFINLDLADGVLLKPINAEVLKRKVYVDAPR